MEVCYLEIITYSQARDKGLPRYFTGKPCIHGHIAEKRVSNQACVECERIKSRKWKALNPDKVSESNKKSKRKAWLNRDAEKYRELKRKDYAKDPSKYLKRTKRWADKNADKHAQMKSDWAKRNRARLNARDAMRRANELAATPKWLTYSDRLAIGLMYENARRLSESKGEQFEVDHIIPLKHDLVCGLHTPLNLQVIPRKTNRQKLNRFEPFEY